MTTRDRIERLRRVLPILEGMALPIENVKDIAAALALIAEWEKALRDLSEKSPIAASLLAILDAESP